MTHDTKTAIFVRDLPVWRKLNIRALLSGMVGAIPNMRAVSQQGRQGALLQL